MSMDGNKSVPPQVRHRAKSVELLTAIASYLIMSYGVY